MAGCSGMHQHPATLEAEFQNVVSSIPVGGSSPSISDWIVWPPII